MKKLSFIAALTLSTILSACSNGNISPSTLPDNPDQPVASCTGEACMTNGDESNNTKEKIVLFEKIMAEKKNAIMAGWFFNSLFRSTGQLMCQNGYFPSRDEISADVVSSYQTFMKPNVKMKCFVANMYTEDFLDQSDECILSRRNVGKSEVCWFNYKKYMPASSSIKTDEEFLRLAETVGFFFNSEGKNQYCLNKKEITTTERAQCEKDVTNFINKIVDGKAPHCRDTNKKAFYNLLEQGKGLLETIENTSVVNSATGYKQQGKTLLFQAVYSDAFNKGIIESIKNFGYEHLCVTAGYEKDLKKIKASKSKTNSRRQGRVVELN